MEFNLAEVFSAVAEAVPDRECIVFRDRRLTYAQVHERTDRLANVLVEAGLGCRTPRDDLAGHESGQDHLALYLHNGNEYLEGMVGGYKARTVPFNVNYRYVAEELEYLLNDSGASAIIYHSAFAPTLEAIRDRLPALQVLLQVPDETDNPLLPDARWYEDALADAPGALADGVRDSWSGDDLYILYTGGTTGMPKGVMWRQADIFMASLGGRAFGSPDEAESIEQITSNAAASALRSLPAAPFMHGAAHWAAWHGFTNGATIVVQSVVDRLDPSDIWQTVCAEGVNVMLIVGDAFGRPLVEELMRGDYDPSSLFVMTSGGAMLSAPVKRQILAALPNLMLMDGLGASETGTQAGRISTAGDEPTTGTFDPGPGMVVLSEDCTRRLEPGDDEIGWLGQAGRVPLGYLGDREKSARTFPVIDGVRYAIPGDRAQLDAAGRLVLHGRDSVTINSGGEKIFAEEVEKALAHHPAVFDVVVCGRPSDRWGNEVVAVVQLREGFAATDAELEGEAARHIARYKLPKAYVRRERILRSPAGKADYRWAREQALSDASPQSPNPATDAHPPATPDPTAPAQETR